MRFILKTTEQFIKEANEIHNFKYNYDKTIYEKANQKIIITCPYHGDFIQEANAHVAGRGCTKCFREAEKIKKTLTLSDFVERAHKVHGQKYDYSNSLYIASSKKISIICKEHGSFLQTARDHLKGRGCPMCSNCQRLTTDSFLEKAYKIHLDIYDYQKVNITNNSTKIIIICKKHGEFSQSPINHLSGQGCPHCKSSKGENKIRNFLIFNNINYEKQKIFKGCKNRKSLKFDFYLPDFNLCIEYDGEGHYKELYIKDSKTDFDNRKLNDQIKNEFCKNNSINLLRIPYWEFKNIEKIIGNIIKNFSDTKDNKETDTQS